MSAVPSDIHPRPPFATIPGGQSLPQQTQQRARLPEFDRDGAAVQIVSAMLQTSDDMADERICIKAYLLADMMEMVRGLNKNELLQRLANMSFR